MLKKLLLGVACAALIGVLGLWLIGQGYFGRDWQSSAVAPGPRPAAIQKQLSDIQGANRAEFAGDTPQAEILFGDLHAHTSFSIDAALFGLPMSTDSGVILPSDACDFARYCSALDFWSINDHAEGMTPRTWSDSVNAVRDCNAQAGGFDAPDLVSFLGWEWSQGRQAGPHYGHKNVIFREWEAGRSPSRPISSQKVYTIAEMIPDLALGTMSLNEDFRRYQDFAHYVQESKAVPTCPPDIDAKLLPDDCREVAETPDVLYRKLRELGLDSVVIPHGLAWGRTNPRDADFAGQMSLHDPDYQKLIETYSGHGNSEIFADFERRLANTDGSFSCAEPTDSFVPCCKRAGELIRQRCEDPQSALCEQRVADAERYAAQVLDDRARGVVEGAEPEEWGSCGQLLNSFLPAWYYVPKQSTQYALALGDFSKTGKPGRARFGIMASSDGHKARPGTGYKEFARTVMTDTKEVGKADRLTLGEGRSPEPVQVSDQGFLAGYGRPNRMGSFYYTGGLIAVHAQARDRDSIWDGIARKQVYGTSGERILLWFDLLNGDSGTAPMGSEVEMAHNPRFRVRALGAFKQKPGCPDYANDALGQKRLQSLCRGECYHPGDERKTITRIEVIRIRPQQTAHEPVAPLIEDVWKRYDCPATGAGCEFEFEDLEFSRDGRESLYYVRAIQEPQPLINGDNYRCEYNQTGECVKINFCNGEHAPAEEDCLAPAEPRAWSSPIFIDHRG